MKTWKELLSKDPSSPVEFKGTDLGGCRRCVGRCLCKGAGATCQVPVTGPLLSETPQPCVSVCVNC